MASLYPRSRLLGLYMKKKTTSQHPPGASVMNPQRAPHLSLYLRPSNLIEEVAGSVLVGQASIAIPAVLSAVGWTLHALGLVRGGLAEMATVMACIALLGISAAAALALPTFIRVIRRTKVPGGAHLQVRADDTGSIFLHFSVQRHEQNLRGSTSDGWLNGRLVLSWISEGLHDRGTLSFECGPESQTRDPDTWSWALDLHNERRLAQSTAISARIKIKDARELCTRHGLFYWDLSDRVNPAVGKE